MSSSRCFSVFVGNLSPKVNWRHLKKLFQRFSQVLDVFIPKKTDVSGSKFGFIGFSTLREAETTAYMFGGAWVVDRRIRVNLPRYRSRSNYWRRKHSYGVPQEKVHQNDNKFDNVPATGKTGEGGYPKEANVESSSKLQGMSLDEKPVAKAKTHKETLRRIHGHCSCPGKKPDRKSSSKTSVNSSESSTTSKQKEKSGSSGDNPIGTDEAINAICLGKSSHDYANSAGKGASRSLGVPELVGGRFEALSGDNVSAGSSLRENGVVSSKNICVDCSLNVPGPIGDISQTQANPIAARV
ncbi:hypothetical protein V6N11_033672 [Hibiscus sabdariffa]|uniref:RRM domain-containing protein n=1 Tax=Hibiscus sabdariffa TaxID=183260 RepID=A0ABR2PYT0_9ROSI